MKAANILSRACAAVFAVFLSSPASTSAQGEAPIDAPVAPETRQQAVTESVDQAAKAAPAGGDVAVAAIKSQLAAATAAFDSFAKAARHVASFTDAGVRAAGNGKSRK